MQNRDNRKRSEPKKIWYRFPPLHRAEGQESGVLCSERRPQDAGVEPTGTYSRRLAAENTRLQSAAELPGGREINDKSANQDIHKITTRRLNDRLEFGNHFRDAP